MPPKGPKIQFNDGDMLEMTFKYDNCKRIKSRQGRGFFWGFDLEQGQISAGDALVSTIREYWPGRGGSLTVEKNKNKYTVVEGVQSDKVDYPLVQVEWDNDQGGFVTIPWDDDPVVENGEPPAVHPGKPQATGRVDVMYSWNDYEYLLMQAQAMATSVLGQEPKAAAEKATYLDVRWKMTYSIVGWARTDRITPDKIKSSLTAEAIDGDIEEAEEVAQDDLPFE